MTKTIINGEGHLLAIVTNFLFPHLQKVKRFAKHSQLRVIPTLQ